MNMELGPVIVDGSIDTSLIDLRSNVGTLSPQATSGGSPSGPNTVQESLFDQIAMAGGGGRCVWQVGFLDSLASSGVLAPRVITTVSAAAMMACLWATRRCDNALRYFDRILGANRRNAYWLNLFSRKPVFPQYGIYRSALIELLDGSLDALRAAPEIRIGVSRAPRWLGPRSAFLVGSAAYAFDTHIRGRLHPASAQQLGFRHEWVRAQDCASVADLAELILHSSCTPPLTPALKRAGTVVLDGGVVDNIPVAGLDEGPGRVLVLLSRPYRNLSRTFEIRLGGQRRFYVQPSRRTPVDSWDYTRPDLVRQTYDLGRHDGDEFLVAL